jgi:hypothetical protein
MKPYILIQGTSTNITDFEDKIASALEEGYEFSCDLITKVIDSAKKELVLLQPMILEEELEFDSEEFEELEEATNDE